MRLQLALKLGLSRARGGASEPYINPDIPAADNIVRCWSLRRNIPAYQNGIAIKADRTDPIGGSPDDGFAVNFLVDGNILIPSGSDAKAYELLDQKNGQALKQDVFASCPIVYSGGVQRKGLFGNNLYLAADELDASLTSALSGSFSISAWALNATSPYADHVIFAYAAPTLGYFLLAYWNGRAAAYVGSTTRIIYSASQYHGATWRHFCLTKTSGVGGVKLYVDGVSAATPVNVPNPTLNLTNPSSILALKNGTLTGPQEVNDIIIYSKELSSSEVQTLFNEQKGYYGIV